MRRRPRGQCSEDLLVVLVLATILLGSFFLIRSMIRAQRNYKLHQAQYYDHGEHQVPLTIEKLVYQRLPTPEGSRVSIQLEAKEATYAVTAAQAGALLGYPAGTRLEVTYRHGDHYPRPVVVAFKELTGEKLPE
jgi:hypothetical protein